MTYLLSDGDSVVPIPRLLDIEDYLDGWAGTPIVVTHDRYFLERVTDVTYALSGDGRCDLLPGGIDQYLTARRETLSQTGPADAGRAESAAARARRTGKELARIESQLGKVEQQIAELHEAMAEAVHDHVRLRELNAQLDEVTTRKEALEEAWFAAADD